MGARRAFAVIVRLTVPILLVFPFLSGCQMTPAPSQMALAEYRDQVNNTGLVEMAVEPLNVSASLPPGWMAMKLQNSLLYKHQQWRSPTRRTAVGVTYIHMPIPLSTQALVWMATSEAGKKSADGKILGRWRDELGREWFEAETNLYHMTGYVMTRGLDAWINYSGYRVREPREPKEIELANRSLATILPLSAIAPAKIASTASESATSR